LQASSYIEGFQVPGSPRPDCRIDGAIGQTVGIDSATPTSRDDEPDLDQGFEAPSTPPTHRRLPKQVWAAIGGLAVVIVVAGYFAAQSGTPTPLADTPGEGIIESLVPTEGSEVLQQGRFGIDLAPGWEATLVINDVVVPEDQLTRFPELNQVFYIPGEGKVIDQLPPGSNCITARFWPSARGQEDSTVRTWCFDVT
jgi:hypothetical protein